MWKDERRDWPDYGVQVVGLLADPLGFDTVAWWTRTKDGWYVSDTRGNLGHRDAMTAADSKGPHQWCHAPKIHTFQAEG